MAATAIAATAGEDGGSSSASAPAPAAAGPVVTRFAPSPSGYLHLGHAFAALFAWKRAQETGGTFLLRIEDSDIQRSRPGFVTALMEDLAWLGLRWPEPVRYQSAHGADYQAALDQLQAQGVLYPCFCTRKTIQEEIARAAQAPHGPEEHLYPGLCRHLPVAERGQRLASGQPYVLRLDLAAAQARSGPLFWQDRQHGRQQARPQLLGDVVLARKDAPASYHLSVVVDDARQGVTLVTRGVDLFAATHLHRLLQALLGLPTPDYQHHPLVTDASGRRLAKRDQAQTLRSLRHAGLSPAALHHRLADRFGL